MAAGHISCCRRLVDEDEAVGFEIELAVEPGMALP